MSISHYATDALTITGQRDMKSNETIRSNIKTNATYAGEQDGFIRYGAGKEINVDAIKEYVEIDRNAYATMNNIAQRKIVALLKLGGCPAHNNKCAYLRNGACVIPKPDIEFYGDRLCCGDAEIW